MAVTYSRPASDVSLRHTVPSFIIFGGGAGNAQINEETQDGDSTYIYQSLTSSQSTVSSTMNMSQVVPSVNRRVTSVKLSITAMLNGSNTSGQVSATFSVNGSGSYSVSGTLTSSYKEFTATSSNMVAAINSSLSSGTIPTVVVQVGSTGSASGKSSTNNQIRITQVYLQVEYEVDSHGDQALVKPNGKWVAATRQWIKNSNNKWEEVGVSELPKGKYVWKNKS